MGLVPLASLGKLAGIDMERIETLIKLGELLLNQNFTQEGRNLENLGLDQMNIEEIEAYLETGIR
jgi:opine dehydrogenase